MMKVLLRNCFLLFELIISVDAFSQEVELKWYTSDDQLPQNTIKSIVKDKHSFIWISTQDGLLRYDGVNFIRYNVDTPTIENRVSMIEGNYENDSLFAFFPDKKAIVVINNRNAKIYKKEESRNVSSCLKHSNRNTILSNRFSWKYSYKYDINFNLNDGSYFHLFKGKVEYFSKKKNKIFSHYFKSYNINNFFISNNELFYLTDNAQVLKFNKNGTIKSFALGLNFDKSTPQLIVNWVNQQAFLQIGKQLYKFMTIKGVPKFELLFESDELKKNTIFSLFFDENNSKLYVGTAFNGLLIVHFSVFKILKANHNIVENHNSIANFNDSLIISSRGAVFKKGMFLSNFNMSLSNEYGIVVIQNQILIQSGNKIFKYDPTKKYKESLYFEIENSRLIKQIIKGKRKIWFTTKLNLDNDKMRFGCFEYTPNGPINSKFYYCKPVVNTIEELDDSNLLLGGDSGLYKFNLKSKKVKCLFEGINIRTIFKTESNYYWLTTYGNGLYLYYDNKVSKIASNNEALLTAHCVLDDGKGFYWSSTNKGLFQFSKKNVQKFLKDTSTPIYFHCYNKSDGLLNNEFNGGGEKSAIAFKSKEFFFPSMDGIVYLNTKTIKPVLSNKEIYVDKAMADDKVVFLHNDTLKLKTKFENLVLYVDAPNYGNPINQKMEYSINEHSNWLLIPENKTITVTNFKSGYSTILLRSLNNFEGKYTEKKIVIYIQPKFWEGEWFLVFLFGLFILFTYLIVKIRTKLVIRENLILSKKVEDRTKHLEETIFELNDTKKSLLFQINNKKRLLRSITHDIKSPLRFLTNTSQYLFEISKEYKQIEISKSIYESSFQLHNYIDNLLNYCKIVESEQEVTFENVNIFKLFEEKKALFDNLAKINANEIINLSVETLEIFTNRVFLNIIVHNLIDNSLKNTKNGKIILDSNVFKNEIAITVSDDGFGMTSEMIDHLVNSFNQEGNTETVGYIIINELIKRINAKLAIESKLGVGTKISILIKD